MDNNYMMIFTKEECLELASVLKKAIVSELMDIKFDVDKYTTSEKIAIAYDKLLRASLEELVGFIDNIEGIKDNRHGYKGYLTYNADNRPELAVKKLEIIETNENKEVTGRYYLAKYSIPHSFNFDVHGMKVYTEKELKTFYEQQEECVRVTKAYGDTTDKLYDVISKIKVTEITKDEYNTLVKMGLDTFGDQSIFEFFTEVFED